MSPTERQQLTEHKRQRTTRLQDIERERARELKTAVSAWDSFLTDWKRTTIAVMTRGESQ